MQIRKARQVTVEDTFEIPGRGVIWLVKDDPTLGPGTYVTSGKQTREVTGVERGGGSKMAGLIVRPMKEPEAAKTARDNKTATTLSAEDGKEDGKMVIRINGEVVGTFDLPPENAEVPPPTITADANNRLTLGSDGGLYLGGMAMSGKVTLTGVNGVPLCTAAGASQNSEGFSDPAAARTSKGWYQGLIDVPLDGKGGIDWHAVEALAKTKLLEAKLGRWRHRPSRRWPS